VEEVGRQRGAEGPVPQRGPEPGRVGGRRPHRAPTVPPGQDGAAEPDGQHQQGRVGEERRPDVEADQRAADQRPGDGPEQEPGRPRTRGPAAQLRRGQPDQRRRRGDGEHRRADAPDRPERQQLPVGGGEGARDAGRRDDRQAGAEDPQLAQPGDEPAGDRGEGDPEHRERADDRRHRRCADAEAAGEERQGGRDDPVPERDHEGRADQDPDRARQAPHPIHRRSE
jgi:hypothetical protein